MVRRGSIALALVALLFCGLVGTVIVGAGSGPALPALAHVQGRLLVCDRLPANGTSACRLASGSAPAIRIHIGDGLYHGLWEGPRFGGVFPPGRYTASGTLDGTPIRSVSFRLSLAHATHLVLIAEPLRT